MARFFSLISSAILTLTLVACSTTTPLTPAQRSRIHRIGVTTTLVDTEVTVARLGITVFGNSHSVYSSSRLGLPETVDKAITSNLRGRSVVPLSSAESQALRAKLEAIPDHGIFNLDEQKASAARFACEAGSGKGLDALLVVRPGSIFVHDNLPVGHGCMVYKVPFHAFASTSLRLLLCEPKTGKLLAQTEARSSKELKNLGPWESVMSGNSPEAEQVLLECIEKAARDGVEKLGL